MRHTDKVCDGFDKALNVNLRLFSSFPTTPYPYAAVKRELANHKIRINWVAPGAIGKPEDIAAAVWFWPPARRALSRARI
jgi:hypothetical protein